MKLIIQIPCYNEEETLPATLSELPKHIDGIDIIETLVINNMLPVQFIEEAKKLVFDECGRKVVIGDSLTPDENILAYEMGNENKPVVDTAEIDIARIDK